jgi:hypothetical protein
MPTDFEIKSYRNFVLLRNQREVIRRMKKMTKLRTEQRQREVQRNTIRA